MSEDTILDELYDGVELEDEEPRGVYGVGQWPDAVLEDVSTLDANEYGYSLRLKFDLKGIGGGFPKDVFVNLPRTLDDGIGHHPDDKAVTAQRIRKDQLASIMHAGDLLPKGKKFPNVDDETKYAKLVEIFRLGVGRTFGLNIKARKNDVKNRTDVWGIRAKA